MSELTSFIAHKIFDVYDTNSDVQTRVDASPEFYRALVHETGVIKDPKHLDSVDEEEAYMELVRELERIHLEDY